MDLSQVPRKKIKKFDSIRLNMYVGMEVDTTQTIGSVPMIILASRHKGLLENHG